MSGRANELRDELIDDAELDRENRVIARGCGLGLGDAAVGFVHFDDLH